MPKSFLFFGTMGDDGRIVNSLCKFGPLAYEYFQLANYMEELLRVRRDPSYLCWTPGIRQLYRACLHLPQVRFEEFGSTLFSTIDKFAKISKTTDDDISHIHWAGIEVAPLLISVATELHPNIKLNHYGRWQDIPDNSDIVVSRCYQSSGLSRCVR